MSGVVLMSTMESETSLSLASCLPEPTGLLLNVGGFAKVNMLLVLPWFALAVLLLREYKKAVTAPERYRLAPISPEHH